MKWFLGNFDYAKLFALDFSVLTYANQNIIIVIYVSPIHHAVREPELPEVGDLVHVSSLSKKGTVLRVEPSKEEIVVQVGNMKLKVKLMDVQT